MGRPASFEKDTVLNSALALFWTKGFSATSLRQLEEVTELHPGSLYHHFQCKEGLYVSALTYYLEHHLQARIDQYLHGDLLFEGIRLFFTTSYRRRENDPYRKGCFLACASSDLHLLPEEAVLTVKKGIEGMQIAFEHQVNRLAEAGHVHLIGQSVDISQTLSCLFLGLQVLIRSETSQHQLDRFVNRTLQQVLHIEG